MDSHLSILTPPEDRLSPWEWVRRNLFSGWMNAALTIITITVLARLITSIVRWALSAQWAVVVNNPRLWIVGLMPVEVAESSYQVRIVRTELIAGSQGDGEYRGGLGLRRDYQVLGRESVVTLYSEQTDPRFAPCGSAGRTDGQPSRITVFDPAGRPLPVGSKASLALKPGSVIRIETSGGGGYGDPARRDPALRAADKEDGRI